MRHQLPPPSTGDVVVQRDLRVPMRDGAVLLADHDAEHPSVVILPVRETA